MFGSIQDLFDLIINLIKEKNLYFSDGSVPKTRVGVATESRTGIQSYFFTACWKFQHLGWFKLVG